MSRGSGATVLPDPPDGDARLREVGGAATWTVSTAKPGNGVDLLRDGRTDTYWQSDGNPPHLINIQFQRKMRLASLAVAVDHRLDESYTPHRVSVRAGTNARDLKEIAAAALEEPAGWIVVPLRPPDGRDCLSAFMLQVAVLSNHQNGRDTHVRAVRVYAPTPDAAAGGGGSAVAGAGRGGVAFGTADALQYASVR